MALLNLDLAESLAIHQEYEWSANLMFEGRLGAATVVGKLFDRYDGNDLATFRVDPPRFLQDINRSRVRLFLPALTTRSLPLTGTGYIVYNVRLTRSGRSPILLLAGRAKVLPALEL